MLDEEVLEDELDSDLLGVAAELVAAPEEFEELEPESAVELDEPDEPFELEESPDELEESPEIDSPEVDVVPLVVELAPFPPRLSVL